MATPCAASLHLIRDNMKAQTLANQRTGDLLCLKILDPVIFAVWLFLSFFDSLCVLFSTGVIWPPNRTPMKKDSMNA